jgi:hypothetical protein
MYLYLSLAWINKQIVLWMDRRHFDLVMIPSSFGMDYYYYTYVIYIMNAESNTLTKGLNHNVVEIRTSNLNWRTLLTKV